MEFVCSRNVHIKDEPDDYTENMENIDVLADSDEHTIVDVDPMNLLEALAERSSDDGQDQANVTTTSDDGGTIDKWQAWIKTYPWLLRRPEGKRLGFCLYCGKNMTVEGAYYLQRHDGALIHKERKQNYEAFLHSCRETFNEDGLVAIKNEIDIANAERISMELITKRLERSKELNDFNWNNWLCEHSWLERPNHYDDVSTKGFCKLCKCIFDVEFSVNRQRHENSIKHKLGEQLILDQENDENPNNTAEIAGNNFEIANEDGDEENIIRINNHLASKILKGRLFDKVPSSSSQRCCRVCRVTMDKHSCRKHLKTKLHRKNMQALAISARKDKKFTMSNMPIDWSKYTKIHRWICADPDDPKFAYCKYCEKRFMYGLSTVKRALHEKSQSHCEAMKRKLPNGNDESNADTNCEEHDRTANESTLKRKRTMFTDEWFELNPCYERNEHDENYIYCKCCKVQLLIRNLNICKHERAERHRFSQSSYFENAKKEKLMDQMEDFKERVVSFPWLKRIKNGQTFCKFCRIVLSNQYRPAVHDQTERHKLATQKYIARKNSQMEGVAQEECGISEDELKPIFANGDWQKKYVWLSFTESESREHYGYCTYCKQSVFVPTAKFASKHECTASHIRAHLMRQNETEPSQISKTEDTQIQNNISSKYKLYKWLLPDPEGHRSFGYCKYCKTRVMTEGLLALGHHNSRSHRKATSSYLQKQNGEILEENTQNTLENGNHNPTHATMEGGNLDESGSEVSLATRLTNAHTEMLSLIREMKGNKMRQNLTMLSGPISAAASLSPSDADICYSRVSEQHNGKLELNVLSQAKRERNTYDLFFESMNETVKRLPLDLAAESRVKIMKIVYDLEMRAMQRKNQSAASTSSTPLSSRSTFAMRDRSTSNPKPNSDTIIPDNNELSTSQCNEPDDEP
ncbi:unnamed protein product [Ceratitis capitata]|uniref:(Mediterranean fruit fly) hypothetical protein n=3 Tax=Ceratitis capitata TaxID=7213 RepID=A0A811U651_CERCA|nr:unnamed protein product [Ceratitis capitata]